jgi:protein-tyrosine kinase
MSRIFEALQRAELERKTNPGLEDNELPETAVISAAPIYQEPAVETAVGLDDIARYPWKPLVASFPTLADRGAGVEQFRSLRSRIFQARYEAPVKTLLISSGLPSEGKSFVAANLAMSLVRNSANNILLIDGDLRRPTLHKLLGAPEVPGLSEYLAGTAEIKDILQRAENPKAEVDAGGLANLTFIPSGKCGDNSSELVANRRVEELIATLAPHFDWILIDSPPVLAVTDAVELSHAADAVLLIARGGSTTYATAQVTQSTFSSSRILGFVLNDVKEVPRGGYSYYNYYGARETAGLPQRP